MTLIFTSPEDVINDALARLGYPMRIGSIYEGSKVSKKALDIYSQTRDQLLRGGDWEFAERNIPMVLLKQAPPYGYIPPIVWDPTLYPPVEWVYEYEYPDDCLEVRSIKKPPIYPIDYDPQPIVFSVENDNAYTPAKKVILCNVKNGILTYTGQITDPTTWEPNFTEAFSSALGRRLGPGLVGLEGAKMAAADEINATDMAETRRG
jgi:hypothetical protein